MNKVYRPDASDSSPRNLPVALTRRPVDGYTARRRWPTAVSSVVAVLMARRIQGILFDLGDTLLDFGRVDIPLLFEAGARLAHDYLTAAGQPVPPFAKYHRRQLWAVRWNYFKSRLTRREFNSLDLIGRLARRMGQTLTNQQMLELAWLWYQPLSEQAAVEPGTREMLLRFRDQGLAMGIVSNTFVPGQILDRHLADVGLADLLPIRIYSCDLGIRKPRPRIFQVALKALNLSADGTLFVGDSPLADIDGANRMGMISVLKDPSGRHGNIKVRPAHRIRRLAELDDIVQTYNGPV